MFNPRVILILGIWIAVLPFLGFPSSWKTVFFVLSGLGLMYIGYLLYRVNKGSLKMFKKDKQVGSDTFSENSNDRP